MRRARGILSTLVTTPDARRRESGAAKPLPRVRVARLSGPRIMIGALVTAFLFTLLWAAQRSLLYFPFGAVASPAEAGLPDAQMFRASTRDGVSLAAWLIPSSLSPPRATVIVFNGNAGNRSDRAPLARRLADAGYQVCLFDYRGYGGNGGSPSEPGLLTDGLAVHEAVRSRAGVDPGRIVLMGESLGTGVVMAIAPEVEPVALVLRSPFTSIADVAAHHYWFLPVRRLLWDRFDSLARARAVRCPVAVVAGDSDRVVPIGLSRRLFDAIEAPKRFITVRGADHNEAELVAGPEIVDALAWALETHGGLRR